MKKIFSSFLLLAFLAGGFCLAGQARAAGASLYFSPSTGTHVLNSKFTVSVRLNSGGDSVNAAQGSINFDKSLLKVASISKGPIFNLWTEEPTFSNSGGTISFGGGIPRPGYTGSNGHIFTITFQAIKAGKAQVSFISGAVLANDGRGTNVLSSMGSASFTISPAVEAPKEEIKGEIPPKEEPKETAAYNKPAITSPSHPDENKWYKEKRVKFAWALPSGADGVSLLFDQKASSDPGPKSDGLLNSKEYTVESDGQWYIHVKIKDGQGRWGTPGHFRVNVDATPPESFVPAIEQKDPNDWPVMTLEAKDAASGLDHYEIIVDSLQSAPVTVPAEQKTYKLSDLSTGGHTAIVKAFDRAGNSTSADVKFDVSAVGAPIITNYSAEIAPQDKFFISGTASPENTINIYIQGADKSDPTSYQTKSDSAGNWFLMTKEGFDKGRYAAWAEAVNAKGLASKQSEKISFLVTPPVFTRIGSFVINYFTVLVSLLFMIILIILMLLLIAEFIRKRLKKETKEIEQVLDKNLDELRAEVAAEMTELSKLGKTDFARERAKAKERINAKIDEAGRKILKEVRDVEKILK